MDPIKNVTLKPTPKSDEPDKTKVRFSVKIFIVKIAFNPPNICVNALVTNFRLSATWQLPLTREAIC